MKPIKLEITGLNSFRSRAEIDFSELMRDGLFGIFGPTGSGKSTILDGITLALYGKVKRAPSGKTGIINVQEKDCSVRFTFELGAAQERKQFTIERTFGKPKGKADGVGVQTKRVRLLEYHDGLPFPVTEKQSETDEKMLEILGIDYPEFLRAVVLPQGSFAEFLGLKPSERSQSLQRLFGLERLGQQLAKQLKAVSDDLKNRRSEIDGQLAQLQEYTDEALAAQTAEAETAAVARNKAYAELIIAERQYQEGKSLYERIERLKSLLAERLASTEKSANLERLHTRIERAEHSEATKDARNHLEEKKRSLANATTQYDGAVEYHKEILAELGVARVAKDTSEETYRKQYTRLCEEITLLQRVEKEEEELAALLTRKQSLEQDLATLAEKYAGLETAHRSGESECAALEELIAELEAKVSALQITGEEHARAVELRSLLDSIGRGRNEIAACESSMTALDSEIAALAESLKSAAEEADTHSAKTTALETELADARSYFEEVTRKRHEKGNLYRQLADLQKQRNEAQTKLNEEFSAATGHLEQVALQRFLHQEKWNAADERKRTAIMAHEDAEKELESARAQDALIALTAHLHDGEACPLCGSDEHPSPFTLRPEISYQLSQAQLKHKAAQNTLAAITEECHALGEHMKVGDEAVKNAEGNVARLTTAIADLQAALKSHSEIAGGTAEFATDEDLARYLQTVVDDGTRLKEELAHWSGEKNLLEKCVAESRDAFHNASNSVARTEERVTSARSKRAEQCTLLEKARTHVLTEEAKLTLLANGRSVEELHQELASFAERADASAKAAESVTRTREQYAEKRKVLESGREELRQIDSLRMTLVGTHSEVAKQSNKLRANVEAVYLQTPSLAKPVRRPLVQMESERDRIQADYEVATARYQTVSSEERNAQKKVDETWKLQCSAEVECGQADRACDAVLREHGFATVTEAFESFIALDPLRKLRNEAKALEDEFRRMETEQHELEAAIGIQYITGEELGLLQVTFENAKTHDTEAAAAMNRAEGALANCREKNAEYHRILDSNTEVSARVRTVEQLGKYLKGDDFVNYLAEEHLSEICSLASIQLQSLTSGRYEVISRPGEGFIVRDFGNTGIERSPSSLSGGETFLVSLSLALALSERLQLGRAPLEFFFLDEGFGTLDSELLETVMNSLERLRSGYRAIGIISHVGALRERIPSRLMVQRATADEGSKVRYEMA